MKWLKHLLGRREAARSAAPDEPSSPVDWSDVSGWDRCLEAQDRGGPFGVPTIPGERGWEAARSREKGGRVWFPGCGIDPGPRFYGYVGCTVLATDFSPVAVRVQRGYAALAPERMFADWPSFVKGNGPFEESGRFEVAEHDFTTGAPAGVFDVVINCRAFQGLSPSAMAAAARHFFAALRPGGAVIIDTINVQGGTCDVLEDSLTEAGFFMPFSASERWYRNQLDSTGIVYAMLLGRPRIPYHGQSPPERFEECRERDGAILDSFDMEFKARLAAEQPAVKEALGRPETIVAYVVYSTG